MLVKVIQNEGWRTELRRYLDDMPSDVTKDTDVVEWWGVSHPVLIQRSCIRLCSTLQTHAKVYPTLAKIALDVLPAQASSVPCERLFSAGKEIAVARRSQLGADLFEQLQMLKFAWRKGLVDHAAWNSDRGRGI